MAISCLLISCGSNKDDQTQTQENQINVDWNEYLNAEFELNRLKVDLDYFLKGKLDVITIEDADEYRELYTQDQIETLGFVSFEGLVEYSIKYPTRHLSKLINQMENVVKTLRHLRSSKDLSNEIQRDRAALLFDEYVDLSGHCSAFKENVQISDYP